MSAIAPTHVLTGAGAALLLLRVRRHGCTQRCLARPPCNSVHWYACAEKERHAQQRDGLFSWLRYMRALGTCNEGNVIESIAIYPIARAFHRHPLTKACHFFSFNPVGPWKMQRWEKQLDFCWLVQDANPAGNPFRATNTPNDATDSTSRAEGPGTESGAPTTTWVFFDATAAATSVAADPAAGSAGLSGAAVGVIVGVVAILLAAVALLGCRHWHERRRTTLVSKTLQHPCSSGARR